MAATHLTALSNGLERVNPIQYPGWDAQLAFQPGCSFFHGVSWAKVLEATYGYVPVYFIAKEEPELRSFLPLMEVNSWLTGRRAISLPFTDNCEPVCRDRFSFHMLEQKAREFGKARGWKYIEYRGGRKLFDEVPSSLSFYGHTLNLRADESHLFAGLESSVRRAIRKAQTSGVVVTISQSLEAVRTFYFLQCKTRKKHGLPPQPFSLFRNIYEYVLARDMGIVAVASYQNKPIAASLYFHFCNRAIFKYGASDERFQHLRGSNLVMWEAIKWYLRKEATELHFGRTSLANKGLRRFKLGWGTKEDKIEYFKYDLRKDQFITDTDVSTGWHNRIFRAMPIYLSRIAGRLLYRHFA